MVKLAWRECPNFLNEEETHFILHPCRALGALQANRFLLQVLTDYRKINPKPPKAPTFPNSPEPLDPPDPTEPTEPTK